VIGVHPSIMTSSQLLSSRRAKSVFRFCAWWITAVAVFFLLVIPAYDRIQTNHLALLAIQVIGGCLGSVGSAAGLVIFIGMFAYLLACDRSSSKQLWTLVFLLTGCFGSSLYFFAIYRRQCGG